MWTALYYNYGPQWDACPPYPDWVDRDGMPISFVAWELWI